MDDITKELIAAALNAPAHRKSEALLLLREGQAPPHRPSYPLLVTVTDAAKMLGTHRSTVWRALRARRLKKVTLYPGCERLRRADVEALAGGAP